MIFGMISTAASSHYTELALRTFFENTTLTAADQIILIENDPHVLKLPLNPSLTRVKNKSPKSFAANMNSILQIAKEKQTDAILLNNDLVFFPNWLPPLLEVGCVLCSPLSNQQYPVVPFPYKFENYENEKKAIALAVENIPSQAKSPYTQTFRAPFFCIRIPHKIIEQVGLFDEEYGIGGAEDDDYIIRSALKDFTLAFANKSFVLHFGGKSSWGGVETAEQTLKRDTQYQKHFREKWGEQIFALFFNPAKVKTLLESSDIQQALKIGNYRFVIEYVQSSTQSPPQSPMAAL
jgi:O-antigen biosynthesis protein